MCSNNKDNKGLDNDINYLNSISTKLQHISSFLFVTLLVSFFTFIVNIYYSYFNQYYVFMVLRFNFGALIITRIGYYWYASRARAHELMKLYPNETGIKTIIEFNKVLLDVFAIVAIILYLISNALIISNFSVPDNKDGVVIEEQKDIEDINNLPMYYPYFNTPFTPAVLKPIK